MSVFREGFDETAKKIGYIDETSIERKAVVLLTAKERISFFGRVKVRAYVGGVSVCGCNITPSNDPRDIYAPYNGPAMIIEPFALQSSSNDRDEDIESVLIKMMMQDAASGSSGKATKKKKKKLDSSDIHRWLSQRKVVSVMVLSSIPVSTHFQRLFRKAFVVFNKGTITHPLKRKAQIVEFDFPDANDDKDNRLEENRDDEDDDEEMHDVAGEDNNQSGTRTRYPGINRFTRPFYVNGFYPLFDDPQKYSIITTSLGWEQLGAKLTGMIERVPIVLVCGDRGVGKSTLTRYLVNQFLNTRQNVVYLDLDVGQPEFTTPGVLSLSVVTQPILGPSFTHLHVPSVPSTHFNPSDHYQIYFGDTTPDQNADYYFECIRRLIAKYRSERSDIPLIINSLGWIKEGMGLDILVELLMISQPTNIVQISLKSKVPDSSSRYIFAEPDIESIFSDRNSIIPELDSLPTGANFAPPESITPATIRDLKTFSYFHPSTVSLTTNNNSDSTINAQLTLGTLASLTPLTSQAPYRVPWNRVRIAIVSNSVPPSQFLYALNGSLVGLCVDCSTDYKRSGGQNASSYPTFVIGTPHPCECVGFGIVRSIDVSRQLLYIVSPVPLSSIKRVNTLTLSSALTPPDTTTYTMKHGALLQAPYMTLEYVQSTQSDVREVEFTLPKKTRTSSPE